MTTTVSARLTVATPDLRDAFAAVLPHVHQTSTDDHELQHRMRLSFARDHLYVLASNGYSAALAIVSIENDSRVERFAADDGTFVVDITPRQAKLVLQQFKAKPTDPDGVEQLLDIDVDTKRIRITDAAGLFAGESAEYPYAEPSTQFPDLVGVISRALHGAAGEAQPGKALVTDGKTLALFKAAAVTYGQPLQIEPTGTSESRGFVVSCGESFLGLVSSRHQDDDSLKRRDAWRRGWLERLPKSGAALAAV